MAVRGVLDRVPLGVTTDEAKPRVVQMGVMPGRHVEMQMVTVPAVTRSKCDPKDVASPNEPMSKLLQEGTMHSRAVGSASVPMAGDAHLEWEIQRARGAIDEGSFRQ